MCHDAELVLTKHGLRPRMVDIDRDGALAAKFGDSVPVVEIDGQIRFRGRIDEMLLRRLLSGSIEAARNTGPQAEAAD